ncbi:transglutaminase domain-containing protein [Pseudoxanthomonas suwonensis]|uniref:transglutaminase domain-containing protein n=1 Tax=Pseudoxanthomonas suwonensis TaxID=314722 RepID=UPI001B876024|nr:transglutaminase domain-containing protein [Pseudoxanthomonas suwonensis]
MGAGLLLLFALGSAVAAVPDSLPQVVAAVDEGRFAEAEEGIADLLARWETAGLQRRALEFERERMRRIRLDFSLNREGVLAQLRRQIPDLREAEFEAWDRAGLVEHMDIDGERRWFRRAVSNLFRLSPEAAARRAPPVRPFAEGPFERLHPHHAEVLAASAGGATSVAPRRLEVTQSIIVEPDAVPAGETVRAWIPYPRAIPAQQEGIRLVRTSPAGGRVAPESAPMRTVYLEATAQSGRPTEFSVTYELTVYARRVRVDPARVQAVDRKDPTLAPFLAERPPHVVFTPGLRAFSHQVVGNETNPYRIAQKLFAAVDRIPWAGAREYSTISNISDHALRAGHADCGQQTLLLITLLRLNGIPARWQSGWTYSDEDVGYDNMHDWGWMYLRPYGWLPMDVTTGQLESDDPALRWFYLGGLDAYRIAFNDDYARDFVPAKTHFRSETVDSQRGEVEWRGGNLYFDQWDYRFQWRMLPVGEGGRTGGDDLNTTAGERRGWTAGS